MKNKWTKIAALTLAVVALGALSVLAQDTGAIDPAMAEYEALHGAEEPGFFANLFSNIGEFISALIAFCLIIVLPVFVIVHMVVVLIKTRALRKPVSLEAMVARRAKKGMTEMATEEENALCEDLMQQAYLCYTEVESDEESGGEMHYPKNMREVRRMQRLLEEAGKCLPTNGETLERYNDYRAALYENLKRSFYGSTKLLWLGGLVAVACIFFAPPLAILLALGTIAYYMASCVPQLMINKKAARGGGQGWFTTMLVAAGLGALGSGYTVRTTYTDGSTSDDNSSYMVALVIGLAILFAVACTIFIWAGISYLRNYVLYI